MELLYLIGAGGHARVVADAILASAPDRMRLRFRDGDPARANSTMMGIPVLYPECDDCLSGARFHVAVGGNAVRQRLGNLARDVGGLPATVLHPAASLSAFALVQDGAFIAAQAVVGPQATVGEGAIVNHGAVVDHDCEVGAFAHIAPGATLSGGVRVGSLALIGAGARILPGLSVGERAVVGAGAVVTKNVPAGEEWVGMPAKRIGRPAHG